MKHIHLKSCPSTFKELEKYSNALVSTDEQTSGKGRGDNLWHNFNHSLAMSFTSHPNSNLGMTSIEVGTLIVLFFKEKFDIQLSLKWPNDIIKDQKKVGGILIKSSNKNFMIGIGLNLLLDKNEEFQNYKIPAGTIFNKSFNVSKKDLSFQLARFIEDNRITQQDVLIRLFNQYCFHLNKEVEIYDGDNCRGKFIGIDTTGAALIKSDSDIKQVYSGSLRLVT